MTMTVAMDIDLSEVASASSGAIDDRALFSALCLTRPRFVAVPSCVGGLNDDASDGDDIGNVHLSPV